MIVQNQNRKIYDIGNILLEGVETDTSNENNQGIVSFFVGIYYLLLQELVM